MEQSKIGGTDGGEILDEQIGIDFEDAELSHASALQPSPLFDLGQLEVSWDQDRRTLWTWMIPEGRPSFNVKMLHDFEIWQREIGRLFGGRPDQLKYLVLGSRFPGVWNFGGDLRLFADYIRAGDRQSLVDYGQSCVGILHRNFNCLGLPIVTIGLVQGDALGGGLEALLSFNVVIAERSAKFGLPEIAFGLFPGMGAHSLLARRLGTARAEQMILSGRTYTAEEMYELGLVHCLVPDGEGEAAVAEYIHVNGRRHPGNSAVYKASRHVMPMSFDELSSIVEIWADTALRLREKDLRLMERLVAAQRRLSDSLSAG